VKPLYLYILGSCAALISFQASGAALPPKPAPQVINFQLRWHHQFQFAGYYAAVEKGFYWEEGFDVLLHEASPGKTPIDEVLAGRAEYGESNSELLYARLQGKPIVALAAIFQHSPSVLLARKDANIYSAHDLIGKKIMLLSDTEADFHAMFLHEGVKPGDIDILPSSLDFEDLISGKVVAFNSYLTNEPFIMKQRGIDFTVINPSTYGIDFYSDILFTTEQEISQHPERVEAFRRATLRGWIYAMNHPEEIIDLLIKKYKVPKSKAHLQFEADAIRQLVMPDLIEVGHMNPERWKRMKDAFIEVGMGPKDFSLEGFIYDPNPPQQVEELKKTIFLISVISCIFLLLTAIFLLGWLRLKKEIRLRKIAEEEVRQLAFHDSLTGIPNRNSFIPYATKQLLAANRFNQKIAFCFIDLDRFKEINDNFGHKAGDAVLVHVANALSSTIRKSDMAARIGGDEFVVLLVGIKDLESTRQAISKIHHAIAKEIEFGAYTFTITASIGTALYPDDGEEIDELMSKADIDMFDDKTAKKLTRGDIFAQQLPL